MGRSAAYSKLMEFGMALKDCEKALESAQKGLEIDPNDKMCLDQLRATHRVINENMSKPADPEAIKRAQEDPEIRAILSDPVVNQVIQDMSKNPGAAQKHMSNPGIAEKINKLIAAGILRT